MADTPAPKPASKISIMWAIGIFVVILIFSNVVGIATGQLNSLFMMLRFNLGGILILMAIVLFIRGKKGNH